MRYLRLLLIFVVVCFPLQGKGHTANRRASANQTLPQAAKVKSPALKKAVKLNLDLKLSKLELKAPYGNFYWDFTMENTTDNDMSIVISLHEQSPNGTWSQIWQWAAIPLAPHASYSREAHWRRDPQALKVRIDFKNGNTLMAVGRRDLPPIAVSIPHMEISFILQGTQMQWRFTIANNSTWPIAELLVLPSGRISGAWVPAAQYFEIDGLSPGEHQYSKIWTLNGADQVRIEIFTRKDYNDPLHLLATKTLNMTPTGPLNSHMLTISTPVITTFQDMLRWTATITNSSGQILTNLDGVAQTRRQGENWQGNGEFVANYGIGQDSQTSLTFCPENMAELRIVMSKDGATVGTSPVAAIDPVYAVTQVTIGDVHLSRAGGGLCNWTAQIWKHSLLAMEDVRVATYRRSGNGQWVQASADQTFTEWSGIPTKNLTGSFAADNSNQFRIAVICRNPCPNQGPNPGMTHHIVAEWQGSF